MKNNIKNMTPVVDTSTPDSHSFTANNRKADY